LEDTIVINQNDGQYAQLTAFPQLTNFPFWLAVVHASLNRGYIKMIDFPTDASVLYGKAQ
jgi:hypothetical protein